MEILLHIVCFWLTLHPESYSETAIQDLRHREQEKKHIVSHQPKIGCAKKEKNLAGY